MELQQLDFSKLGSMEIAIVSNKPLEKEINEMIQKHYTIDVSSAMNKLANVGQILKLAYAGSKGFPCSENTIEILCKYQTMIKNSHIATDSFVDACLSALKYHKYAILMAEKDKLDNSIKMIKNCSVLANRMAIESGKLVEEAQNLCDLAEKALITAHSNNHKSKEETIVRMINESQAKEAEFKKKIEILYKQIDELRTQQAEISKKADAERTKEFVLQTISTMKKRKIEEKLIVVQNKLKVSRENGKANDEIKALETEETQLKEKLKTLRQNNEERDINNNNNQMYKSQATVLEEKEMLIMNLKAELQKEEREANSELAKLGEILKGLKSNDEDLNASICSLQIAIKALGRIKVIFEHTRQFWCGVESQCKELGNIDALKGLSDDKDFKNEYIEGLRQSGLNWLSLGKINYNAHQCIKKFHEKADNILSNSPTKFEALSIIQNEADMILKSLLDSSLVFTKMHF